MKRPPLRPLLLFAALLCCARAAAAQEPCRLERAVAPDYGGVMLGMRPEELSRMFPGSDELQRAADAGAVGARPFVASLGMLELALRRDEFGDAAELVLTFLEGRLRRIDVRYARHVTWRDISAFSEFASKRLAVPADAWGAPASDAEKQSRVLDCRGFSVVVRIDGDGGPSTLSIVDTAEEQPPAAASAPAADQAPPSRRPRKRP